MEYKEQYKYLTNICLNLTDACNLACRYCFVEQHPHFITYDIAKDAVDWLINNLHIKKQNGWCDENEVVSLSYFGGEPTLLWDEVIVPLTIYAKEKYKDEIQFGITTNGTLLNKERINFLKKYNIYPLLSIDGAEETQNYNRPCHDGTNSFDKVIKNIPYLLEAFPEITFRSTIIPATVNNVFKNYLFAEFLGFKNYFAVPNARENWTEESIEILKQQLQLIFEYRLVQYQNNEYVMGWSSINNIFEQILRKDMNTMLSKFEKPLLSRDPYRCGLGTSMGSIAYDGSIYGCQEQPSKDDKNIFLIGNIYENGINQEKHMILLEEYTRLKYCKCSKEDFCENCYFKSVCKNFACPSSSWDLFNDFLISPYIDCKWFNFLYENAIIIMNILVKENNLYFKDYLYNECKYKLFFKEKEEI